MIVAPVELIVNYTDTSVSADEVICASNQIVKDLYGQTIAFAYDGRPQASKLCSCAQRARSLHARSAAGGLPGRSKNASCQKFLNSLERTTRKAVTTSTGGLFEHPEEALLPFPAQIFYYVTTRLLTWQLVSCFFKKAQTTCQRPFFRAACQPRGDRTNLARVKRFTQAISRKFFVALVTG